MRIVVFVLATIITTNARALECPPKVLECRQTIIATKYKVINEAGVEIAHGDAAKNQIFVSEGCTKEPETGSLWYKTPTGVLILHARKNRQNFTRKLDCWQ